MLGSRARITARSSPRSTTPSNACSDSATHNSPYGSRDEKAGHRGCSAENGTQGLQKATPQLFIQQLLEMIYLKLRPLLLKLC